MEQNSKNKEPNIDDYRNDDDFPHSYIKDKEIYDQEMLEENSKHTPGELESIIERKKQGVDCNEDESAQIKTWLRDNMVMVGSEDVKTLKDIIYHFPLEYTEWAEEDEATAAHYEKMYPTPQPVKTQNTWFVVSEFEDDFFGDIKVKDTNGDTVCTMPDNWSIWNSEQNYEAAKYERSQAEAKAKLVASIPALLEENKLLKSKVELLIDIVKNQDVASLSLMLHNAQSENKQLKEALKAFHNMFIHREGETKKNQLKTDMIKYCEEVKAALNHKFKFSL